MQSSFIKILQRELATAFTSPGLILGFLRDTAALSEPRIGFNLPWSAAETPRPPSDDLLIAPLLRFPRPESVRQSLIDDSAEVISNGKALTLTRNTGKVLATICGRSRLSVGALIDEFENEAPKEQILGSLAELVIFGIVELVDS